LDSGFNLTLDTGQHDQKFVVVVTTTTTATTAAAAAV
jgi:hypothetical protein